MWSGRCKCVSVSQRTRHRRTESLQDSPDTLRLWWGESDEQGGESSYYCDGHSNGLQHRADSRTDHSLQAHYSLLSCWLLCKLLLSQHLPSPLPPTGTVLQTDLQYTDPEQHHWTYQDDQGRTEAPPPVVPSSASCCHQTDGDFCSWCWSPERDDRNLMRKTTQ